MSSILSTHLPVHPRVMLKNTLAEAHRAKLKGRVRQAIGLYEYALTLTSDHAMISSRLAPLLAHEGRHFEAWRQFQKAGRALMRREQPEWALAVYRDATRMLPMEFDAWRITASIERLLERHDHALETLLEGRRRFRSSLHRDQAIALLDLARRLEPWDADIVIDLAQLLQQAGQSQRADDLLDELLEHSPQAELPRIHAARSRITWSPRHVLRWLESFVRALMSTAPQSIRPHYGALRDCPRSPGTTSLASKATISRVKRWAPRSFR